MVIEAYTSLQHTILYYDYNVLPFNFELTINVSYNSSPTDYKEEIDSWMNLMPRGEVANWVVSIHIKLS